NMPEKTAEALTEDGWLLTGDVGEFDEAGYLRIVDRKKELIINAAGKNMSPANIESKLKSASPLIAQTVAAEVEQAVEEANQRLSRVEQIKRFKVLSGEWAPGGEELTPTMKLKRRP